MSFEVIVLGLGGMGSAACYHLARRGHKVLGLEQFSLGHDRGSSHGETRIIRRAYFEHPNYVPLLNRAYELWDDLEKESGEKLFERCGLVLYGDPRTSAVYRGTLESAARYQIPVEALSADEASARFPLYKIPAGLGAILEPGAGFLHVERSVKAHADQARAQGAKIHEGERVLSYRALKNSVEVKTDRTTYHAAKLIVAGGAWSEALLRELKLPLKIFRVWQFWLEAASAHQKAPCFAYHHEGEFIYGFPSLDGKSVKVAAHFTKEPLVRAEDKDAAPAPQELRKKLGSFLQDSIPTVGPTILREVACLYTMTPDEHFIVDRHPTSPALVLAAGFSGHGFKFSSVIGEALADLATEGKTSLPIEFLSATRFIGDDF